jgi:hypothetical protein
MDGEIRHKSRSEVIINPENYEDIKKKYLEREEEQLQKVLARRKTDNTQELESIAAQAITTRANRAASEHKPLKDRTILRDAKNEDILDLKKKLNDEINAIGKRILASEEEGNSVEKKGLKGRVSQTHTPSNH